MCIFNIPPSETEVALTFDGEFGAGMCSVCVIPHESSQSKVGNLHDELIADQAIPGSQIP
jgi:hypothetical protein